MKILHTADWHLGRMLYGKKRYEEFSAFLDWLLGIIQDHSIDVLLVAGDVFDTTTPSNRAQKLYYQFLCKVAASCCRHVVVIGGNHDSPSFLNAPKDLLHALDVHVVGAACSDLEDEVIVLTEGEEAEAIVCAVPYLRDRDIRTATPGETIDEKNEKLVLGVKNHYREVCSIAKQKQSGLVEAGRQKVPIIAMGHLFTAGGNTVDGDGVRELYVGSLAHVGKEIFPTSIDYLALGHLHVPQVVGGEQHLRYSGSPIPMGYGEAGQEKQVVVVQFEGTTPEIECLPVPVFQRLIKASGSFEEIKEQMEELKKEDQNAWLEIDYSGHLSATELRERLEEITQDSSLEVLRVRNPMLMRRTLNASKVDETLEDLNEVDVFLRCLELNEVPDEGREELIQCYKSVVSSILEEDSNAE